MKKTIAFFFLIFSTYGIAQKVSFETLLNDKISIRAITIYDNKVWYSGTNSKFGFVNLDNSKNQKQIKLSEKGLEFRTLAQNEKYFFTINIESPAYFFKINKKDLTSELVFKDTVKTAFYDALHFVNNQTAYSFSDSDADRKLKLAIYKNQKWSFFQNDIKLNEGEAAFAASNSNIASYKNNMWIATGGKSSRILKINLKNQKIQFFNTPFIQGEASQGMYSIDFYKNLFGIAVGGDYTKQEGNVNNIATTIDGGKTWQIVASGKNSGYATCVKIKPNSKGKEIVAVGDKHISYSSDFGKTWNKISDEKGLYVCEWVNNNTMIFAGKDRILKMKIE